MTATPEQNPTAEGQSPGNPDPNPARSHRELNNRTIGTAMLAAEERGHGRPTWRGTGTARPCTTKWKTWPSITGSRGYCPA